MFKTFGLQVRRDGLSHQQYVDHWLTVHAPMSNGVAGLRGYVANEVILAGTAVGLPGSHPDFGSTLDGVAQLHFDSQDGIARMAEAPAVREWFADGPNFVGLRTGFVAEEHVVRSPGEGARRGAFKAIVFLAGERAVLDDALDAAGAGQAAGLVRSRIAEVTGSTNLPGFEVPPVDRAVELWGDSPQDAIAAAARLADAVGEGAVVSTLIAREHVIHQPPQ